MKNAKGFILSLNLRIPIDILLSFFLEILCFSLLSLRDVVLDNAETAKKRCDYE